MFILANNLTRFCQIPTKVIETVTRASFIMGHISKKDRKIQEKYKYVNI